MPKRLPWLIAIFLILFLITGFFFFQSKTQSDQQTLNTKPKQYFSDVMKKTNDLNILRVITADLNHNGYDDRVYITYYPSCASIKCHMKTIYVTEADEILFSYDTYDPIISTSSDKQGEYLIAKIPIQEVGESFDNPSKYAEYAVRCKENENSTTKCVMTIK